MKIARRRKSQDGVPVVPRAPLVEEAGIRHLSSPTAIAAEMLRTGVSPLGIVATRREIPREDDTIRVGDPDDRSLANTYVGEDTPGGTSPTPDQSIVDEIGRAYGLQEEDTGALRSGSEVLARRDRRRIELQAPGKAQI